MSVPPTPSPTPAAPPEPTEPTTAAIGSSRRARARGLVRASSLLLVRTVVVIVLGAALLGALVGGGLFVVPAVGAAAYAGNTPPRRPPIVPPSVPLGAREDWAIWSYVDKINQVWGKDWPLAIEWFEELDARYPGNPMVLDKLYVAYIEDGRRLQSQGDLESARRRYEQAARYDPDRGAADDFLADLDKIQTTRR